MKKSPRFKKIKQIDINERKEKQAEDKWKHATKKLWKKH